MGNKINLKTDGGWESNSNTRYGQYPVTKSFQDKYTFDLNLRRYRGSKFRNPPFCVQFLADTSFEICLHNHFYVISLKKIYKGGKEDCLAAYQICKIRCCIIIYLTHYVSNKL